MIQSQSESIPISVQLQGKKYDDFVKDKEAEQERVDRERDLK